ncbi:hypothetical protein BS78_03G278900 [Paspalum vaginatum]|nr:hypothetical protein BS78_03G278900 [Paspalum vaginatum]
MALSSAARHLFLVALVAVLAVAAPRAADAWGGGRFFFSKTTRAAEPEKAAAAVKPDAADPNAAPAFSRPSTGGGSGRGYGLYGRPEENYPPDYFRRGVHRNPQKLTTTAAATDVPVPATTGGENEAVPVAGAGGGNLGGVQPYPEDGSGRGRPPWYYTAFHGGRQRQEQRRDYGMSDTRLYQNGRYYYDVDAGRYGYGRESNPMMRTRPEPQEEEDLGSGYGRPRGAGDRRGRGRYGNAAGYHQQQDGSDNEFGTNGAMDQNQSEFQGEMEGQNERYVP